MGVRLRGRSGDLEVGGYSSAGARLVDRSAGGPSVIPSLVGMECCDRFAVGEVNQKGRPRRVRGS